MCGDGNSNDNKYANNNQPADESDDDPDKSVL